MAQLSVVIITKNEAEDIERCLQSVQWIDERIVIDSGSSDTTKEIARTFATKVVERQFKDFADQRNWGLEIAQHEWVLMLDADEVVSEELRKEIEQAIEQSSFNGYFIPRSDYAFGKWLQYGETRHASFALLRLARKNKGRWINPIHEVWEVEGKVGKLTNPLLHYSHPDLEEFIDKLNRYTTADAEALFKQGIKTSAWAVMVFPCGKFLSNYFLKLGFIDGAHGFIFAVLMAFYSFTKRAKLWMLWYGVHKRK